MRTLMLAGMTAAVLSACSGVSGQNISAPTPLVVTPVDATSTAPDLPAYGVEETTRRPVTPGETICAPDPAPAHPVDVTGADPGAPTVIFGVPDGFTDTGTGPDGVLRLSGPDQMTATVTITPTTLDAAAAFNTHADALTAAADISSLSVLPGDLCGYSGQEMMGSSSDGPGTAVEFADRVVHVWTAGPDYLVVVHLQAPSGTAGFDTARQGVFADFGIRLSG